MNKITVVIPALNEYDKSIDDGFVLAEKREATVIVTFDADGQHCPEDIEKIVKPILSGEAIVRIFMREYQRQA